MKLKRKNFNLVGVKQFSDEGDHEKQHIRVFGGEDLNGLKSA